MNLAFVGLGRMGTPIARNLSGAGHTVTVYNRTRNKAEELQSAGAQVANSPAEACSRAEAVFTMLSDDIAASEVVFGHDGVISGLPRNAIHLSVSTISVKLARHLEQEHARANQGFLSTPVFGRPDAAQRKALIVIAGGQASLIDRMRPALEAIGRAVFIAGEEPWQANLLKLCGNFMIASMMGTLGEAFAAMRRAGADHHTFLAVMNELFNSPVYKNYGATIADEKFEPAGFALKLGLKDIRTVLEAAGEMSVAMPIASVVRDQFLTAMARGQEQMDWSSVARVPAENAGLPS